MARMMAQQFLLCSLISFTIKTVTGTGTQTYNISLAGSANDYAFMTTMGFTQTRLQTLYIQLKVVVTPLLKMTQVFNTVVFYCCYHCFMQLSGQLLRLSMLKGNCWRSG